MSLIMNKCNNKECNREACSLNIPYCCSICHIVDLEDKLKSKDDEIMLIKFKYFIKGFIAMGDNEWEDFMYERNNNYEQAIRDLFELKELEK